MTAGESALLLALARAAIRGGLRRTAPEAQAPAALPPALARPAATFVTLSRGGALRGCIGELEARYPLAEAVPRAAYDAAFRDPRFRPVTAAELDSLELEIAVLGALQELAFADEAELVAQLERGVHGLLIEQDGRRATFLPKVWDGVRDPELFLARLKEKAGLAPLAPLTGARAWRYGAEVVACDRVGAEPLAGPA